MSRFDRPNAARVLRFRLGVRRASRRRIRAIPTLDADGEIAEWVESQAALRELTANLEETVRIAPAEREDARAQVHELQKVETLGQVTGGIAHDFNNLLAPIVGTLEILGRKTDDERTLRLIGGALAAADRSRSDHASASFEPWQQRNTLSAHSGRT